MNQSRNPWTVYSAHDQRDMGRAVVTVGLAAGPRIRFTRARVERLVRLVGDASIVHQVGTTQKWGREESVSITILNMGHNGRPRLQWKTFRSYVELVSQRLANALAQDVVILETQTSNGTYGYATYVNLDAEAQRREILARRDRARPTPTRNNPRTSGCGCALCGKKIKDPQFSPWIRERRRGARKLPICTKCYVQESVARDPSWGKDRS